METPDFERVRDHLRSCESSSLDHAYSLELVEEVERLRLFIRGIAEYDGYDDDDDDDTDEVKYLHDLQHRAQALLPAAK